MKLRALREEQVEAERILLATQSALDADRQLISESEFSVIDGLMQAVRTQMQQDDHEKLHSAITALANGTEEFAARRMDQSVRTALAGKRLNDIE